MITSVIFGAYVKVITGTEHKSKWEPGKDGIVAIREGANGVLLFETNKAGVTAKVWPPAGTVVVEEDTEVSALQMRNEQIRAAAIAAQAKQKSPGPYEQNPSAAFYGPQEAQQTNAIAVTTNGPTSSPPSSDPPRARPIRKGR